MLYAIMIKSNLILVVRALNLDDIMILMCHSSGILYYES